MFSLCKVHYFPRNIFVGHMKENNGQSTISQKNSSLTKILNLHPEKEYLSFSHNHSALLVLGCRYKTRFIRERKTEFCNSFQPLNPSRDPLEQENYCYISQGVKMLFATAKYIRTYEQWNY